MKMSIIDINAATFCGLEQILQGLAHATGYQIIGDDELIRRAARADKEDVAYIHSVFRDRKRPSPSLFKNSYLALAKVKTIVAGCLMSEPVILHGLCSMMVPKNISHVLRVGILADADYRISQLQKMAGLSNARTRNDIRRDDDLLGSWAHILGFGDPWNPDQYDLFIPMHQKTPDQAVSAIVQYSKSKDLGRDKPSMDRAGAFLLASRVELALAREGHLVQARARGSEISLTIPGNIILMKKLEAELQETALKIPGVSKVNIVFSSNDPGNGTDQDREHRNRSRLLLVDDEREFVHTLSERLLMREIGSSIVYDGEQALARIEKEQPEIIVLDLKMPGMNGIEVLKRVKQTHPQIRLIILSGHGSREDEEKCLELGAAAYLQKPVDIDKLISLLKVSSPSSARESAP
ncbi:MAG: response regulator [Desulfonatronovibrionaceae bacterium]